LSGFEVEGGKVDFCDSWGRKNRLFPFFWVFGTFSFNTSFFKGLNWAGLLSDPTACTQVPVKVVLKKRKKKSRQSSAKKSPDYRSVG
jgi:hypothetical protein